LPPIVEISSEAGSGGEETGRECRSLHGRDARSRSRLHAQVVAVDQIDSVEQLETERDAAPRGFAPPESPERPPMGATSTPCLDATASTRATAAALAGRTTTFTGSRRR
jgi:hypothetical protein